MRVDRTETAAQRVFAALADPTRRSVLADLARHGSATASELAERLPISRQGVSKHLGLLAAAGLVEAVPGEGRRVRYHLDSTPIRAAQQYLAVLARDWDSPLARLRDHLDYDRRRGDAS